MFYSEFVSTDQQKKKNWATDLAIHTIYVEDVPQMAILKRKNKNDLLATQAATRGDFPAAIKYAKEALKEQPNNALLWTTLGTANLNGGHIKMRLMHLAKPCK